MDKLPCLPYLENQEEQDCDAIRGMLRCRCGCETFRILHSGKQAHPWLGSWYCSWILPAHDPLIIRARCSACGTEILLHCDERSAEGWRLPATYPMTELIHPKLHDQRVQVEVSYGWENSMAEEKWSTAYTDFCMDVWNQEHPKKIRVFE